MKKRIIGTALAVLMLAAVLAGCAGNGTSSLPATSAPQTEASSAAAEQPLRKIVFQANFLVNTSQMGEIAAMRMGYFAEEGLEVEMVQGGPQVDPTASVVGGHTDLGEFSSSPSLILGVSEGRPLKTFAVVSQIHPYAYISLPDNPVRTPQDLIGKRIGVNQTGIILLDALLKENGISRDQVEVVTISGEITPLLAGQVDVWTGWVVQQGQLKELPEDYVTMTLWETGIHLYSLGYFATQDTLDNDSEMLAAFLRAATKGWLYARENTEEVVGWLCEAYPELVLEDEMIASEKMLELVFPEGLKAFGDMDPAVWQEQIDIYDELGMIEGTKPNVEDVMTDEILKMTQAERTL